MAASALLFVLLFSFSTVARSDITGSNPSVGSCLCFTTNAVNVRDTACGTVVGQANAGDCFDYKGEKEECLINNQIHEYFKMNYFQQDGWSSGRYLDMWSNKSCHSDIASEFRGMWVATVSNIDWPVSPGLGTITQRSDLLAILDKMVELKMNALIFQIRPAGDAFYASTLEPWSGWLTGSQGQAPDPLWEPLDFAIKEAHQRNIEVHAWLNPYRANTAATWDGLAPNHMANRFPQYAYPYGNYLWMDPGAKVVQDHLSDVITDIITRYDVDGIHYDDYFYPYPVSGVDFPDDLTYDNYLASGGTLNRADWRRDNVNKMVQRSHDVVKNHRKSIKFGIAPFGIYRPGHPEGMPPPIVGMDQYQAIFADPKLWFQSGWLDYIAPQLYWEIDPPQQSYPTLLNWWLQINTRGRHVYAGNAVYKMDATRNDWPVSEITDQIEISRSQQQEKSFGNIFFSYKWFRANYKGITDTFKSGVYSVPAKIPDMPWLLNQTSGIQNKLNHDLHENEGYLKWMVTNVRGEKQLVNSISKLRLPPGKYTISSLDSAMREAVFHVSPAEHSLG